MRRRWQLILPAIGLILFSGVTHDSLQRYRQHQRIPSQLFWWSSIRLNSDPLNRHHSPAQPCLDAKGNCASWDPASFWVDPGLLAVVLMVSAFPAFVVGKLFVHALGQQGVNEIASFMVLMPMLVSGWYFAVGWLVDRERVKKRT